MMKSRKHQERKEGAVSKSKKGLIVMKNKKHEEIKEGADAKRRKSIQWKSRKA